MIFNNGKILIIYLNLNSVQCYTVQDKSKDITLIFLLMITKMNVIIDSISLNNKKSVTNFN